VALKYEPGGRSSTWERRQRQEMLSGQGLIMRLLARVVAHEARLNVSQGMDYYFFHAAGVRAHPVLRASLGQDLEVFLEAIAGREVELFAEAAMSSGYKAEVRLAGAGTRYVKISIPR